MYTEDDYKKIFSDLEFIELEPIKKDIKSGYYISHGKIKDNEVVIRILTKTDKLRVKNYKKELAISKILENGKPKEILSRFACTKEIGENDKFIWSIRDYVDGEVISLYDPKKILMGFDEINSKFEKKQDSIINGIKENLIFLWSIESTKDDLELRERFDQDIDKNKIKFIESNLGFPLSKQVKIYNENKDKVFSLDKIKASFGDLIPANIIYTTDEKVVFLDFEWFSFDHYLADVSFLWLYLWNYPAWRKKLLDSFIETEDEKKSFQINILRQLIGFYSQYIYNQSEDISEGVAQKRKIFFKHIFTRYLKSAGESYKDLINTK
jgi:hypothetical protein